MKINTHPMNMDALDFDGDMWDPEYCDSELRAVEASGESRDELCPCQQTADTQSQADGWYTCDQCLAVAQRSHGQEMLLGLPINYARLHPDLRCLAEFLSLAVLSIQRTSF